MRVADIMTRHVHTVPPAMSASDAWEFMRRKSIHHLVVVEGTTVVGVLSDRDAGGRSGDVLRAQSTVGDLMTANVLTTTRDTTVRQVANVMRGRTIGCLPVMYGGRLEGIVTVSDLLRLLGRGIDRPLPPARRGLNHRAPHRKRPAAAGAW